MYRYVYNNRFFNYIFLFQYLLCLNSLRPKRLDKFDKVMREMDFKALLPISFSEMDHTLGVQIFTLNDQMKFKS